MTPKTAAALIATSAAAAETIEIRRAELHPDALRDLTDAASGVEMARGRMEIWGGYHSNHWHVTVKG